jgi:DNA-binding transcriptional ArsR family regulator
MSSLLPIRSEPSTGGQDPRVVDLEGEDAEQVFSALSSTTARRIVATLHEEPRTQSDLAEELDTTVQNVRYHLDNLEEAGLVEVVDTWYSSRGNEMQVFAPADGALIVSGDEGTASRLRSALSRLIGGVAVLGLASLFVQTLVQRFGRLGGAAGGSGFVEPGGAGAGDDQDVGLSNGTDYDFNSGNPIEEGSVTPPPEEAVEADSGATGTPVETRSDATATDSSTETAVSATTEPTSTDTTTTTVPTTTEKTATAEGTPTTPPDPTTTPTEAPATTTTVPTTPEETRTVVETTAATTGRPPATAADGTTTVADTAREAIGNATTTVDPTTATNAADAGGLPPGIVFFLGGVSVLVVLTSAWYVAGR